MQKEIILDDYDQMFNTLVYFYAVICNITYLKNKKEKRFRLL